MTKVATSGERVKVLSKILAYDIICFFSPVYYFVETWYFKESSLKIKYFKVLSDDVFVVSTLKVKVLITTTAYNIFIFFFFFRENET